MDDDRTFYELANRYDAWYATPIGRWADRYETGAVFHLLNAQPGERVLDIGAGTGRHAVALAQRGAAVVGIDHSDDMLRIAAERTAGLPVELVRGDATRLPFDAGSFDAVLAVTSLCFISDPAAVLREAARVRRPGGRIVLGELNRTSLWGLLRRAEALVRDTTYRDARFRSIGELRQLLRESGLEVVRWEGMLHLPPVNNARFLDTLDPVERWCQRVTPHTGAFLAIEARHRTSRRLICSNVPSKEQT